MYHAYLSPDFYNLSAAACGCSLRIRLGCYYEISFVGSDFIRGKTGRIGNSRAGTVNGYNWGGIILMLFHVLSSPDRVVRVFLTGAYFGKGREPGFGRKAGVVRPGSATRSFARRSRQFAQRVDQRAAKPASPRYGHSSTEQWLQWRSSHGSECTEKSTRSEKLCSITRLSSSQALCPCRTV